MKRFFLFLTFSALLTVAPVCFAAVGDEVTRFDRNNFEGWKYTRSTVTVDKSNIINKKINLFKDADNTDFTLVSPNLDLTGVTSLEIEVDCYSQPSSSGYSPKLNSPTFEILDDYGNVVSNVFYLFKDAQLHRTFTTELEVPADTTSGRLRLACWDANSANALTIMSVVVTVKSIDGGIVAQKGDVNNDGSVNVGDVAEVYKIILGTDLTNAVRANINGDENINAGDVSALYLLIMGQ